MLKNIKKTYTFIVNDKAFEQDVQRSRISNTIIPFDATISKMNHEVEALDRYDDFDELKISCDLYKHQSGEYGIPVNPVIQRNGSVILNNQKRAAARFLKELRGFGLLADVVGSGKTFEACVVLSELAIRKRIKTMLLIVPSQVYDSWIYVLEKLFGLGKGTLKEVGSDLSFGEDELVLVNGIYSPNRPIIVRTEDFAKWNDNAASYLFDVIVVDEAHHLCQEEGEYAHAMRLLSMMMMTKKRAASTYCILLSATPHSGNLEKMFRLWYFIRCRGGNPLDFRIQEEKLCTDEYRQEKEYYKNHVCRGASTVMEFINNVKLQEVEANNQFKKIVTDYINVARNDSDNESYQMLKSGRSYDELSASEKATVITKAMMMNSSFADELQHRIASAYHNGVLRSIMIRQSHDKNESIAKKKIIVNMLFYPTKKTIGVRKIKSINNEYVTVDCNNLYENGAITVENGRKYSLKEYIDLVRGNSSFAYCYAEFMINCLLQSFGDMSNDSEVFTKHLSGKYYLTQLENDSTGATNYIYPVSFKAHNDVTDKVKKTLEILRNHGDKRVIVFFDYDDPDFSEVYDSVNALLHQEKDISERILECDDLPQRVINRFNEKSDAILLVNSPSFTEGANLQKCAIIINFQVTPDPLSMDQRIGRVFRLGQSSDVIIYSLANMNCLEGYALMYFLRIGLLGSNFGDATIIAGSNNERMVAVRCPACKNVRLLSLDEYELQREQGELYCHDTDICCQYDIKGTLMEEICVYDFKCDKCGSTFTRTINEGGYRCIANNNTGREIMCNSGDKGDRKMYCRKICSIAHCDFFQRGAMAGKCKALEKYKENKNISDSDLMTLCALCPNRSKCPQKCHVGSGASAINGCKQCIESQCTPKPHVLVFDEKWQVSCPKCSSTSKGKIKPVLARTFAAYIYALWNFEHDGGRSFVSKLLSEADKVAEIKQILDMDESSEDTRR